MGGPRRPRCGNGKCYYVQAKRGNFQVCKWCGDRYPCTTTNCGHVDCHIERGEPPPRGVTYIDPEGVRHEAPEV